MGRGWRQNEIVFPGKTGQLYWLRCVERRVWNSETVTGGDTSVCHTNQKQREAQEDEKAAEKVNPLFSRKAKQFLYIPGVKVKLCNLRGAAAASVASSDNCGEAVNTKTKLAQVGMSHRDKQKQRSGMTTQLT